MGHKMAKMSATYRYIRISVAKPYGRFGQKLESLQAGQERIGHWKTGQGRKVQGRGAEQKRAEQGVSKSRAGHDAHGHCVI